MVIFIILGMKTMNKQIYENIPDIVKLKDIIKNQNEKRKEIQCLINNIKNNPQDKKKLKENNFTDSKNSLAKVNNSPDKTENGQEINHNPKNE